MAQKAVDPKDLKLKQAFNPIGVTKCKPVDN